MSYVTSSVQVTKTNGGLSIGPSNGNITNFISTASSGNKNITFQNTTDTVVCLATSDVLTNKTITDSTNTVGANILKSNTGTPWSINLNGITPPSSGQVLLASNSSTVSWSTPNIPKVYTSSGLIILPKIYAVTVSATGTGIVISLTSAGFLNIYSVNITGSCGNTTPNNQILCTVQSISTTSLTVNVVTGTTVLLGGATLIANTAAITLYVTVIGS